MKENVRKVQIALLALGLGLAAKAHTQTITLLPVPPAQRPVGGGVGASGVGPHLYMRLVIKNVQSTPLAVPAFNAQEAAQLFDIAIRDGKGQIPASVKMEPQSTRLPIGSGRSIFLAPGQSSATNIDLGYFFRLSRGSHYHVAITPKPGSFGDHVRTNEVEVSATDN